MARSPKTLTSAVRATSTSIAPVEKCTPLAMDRTTKSSKAVLEKAKLPVAAAIRKTVANKDSADGCLFSPDEKAIGYRGTPELQPDLRWQSTEDNTTPKPKKHQFDKKVKDTRDSKSGQAKRGRPKMTNGRRGG